MAPTDAKVQYPRLHQGALMFQSGILRLHFVPGCTEVTSRCTEVKCLFGFLIKNFGFRISDSRFRMPTAHCLPPTAYRPPPTAYRPPPTSSSAPASQSLSHPDSYSIHTNLAPDSSGDNTSMTNNPCKPDTGLSPCISAPTPARPRKTILRTPTQW